MLQHRTIYPYCVSFFNNDSGSAPYCIESLQIAKTTHSTNFMEVFMDETIETLDETLCEAFTSTQDPGGSYTGTSLEGDPEPEQDADDL